MVDSIKVLGIIRSLGERTEEYSFKLLKEQIDEVRLVKGITPITNMTIECLKIGILSGADYMITCDADVFILTGIVEKMIKKIESIKAPIVTGHTKSKFFGKRQGGIRIWDCSKLNEMLKLISNNKVKDSFRPEGFLHTKFKGIVINDITSYHEYEQFYKDIYYKFANHSIKSKSKKYQMKKLKLNSDMDNLVAYHGFFDEEKDFKKSFPDLKEKSTLKLNKDIYDKYR